MTMTRFNRTINGYTKCDEHQIGRGLGGAEQLHTLIEQFKARKGQPQAWCWGIFEDGPMSKWTYRRSTAIVLDYQVGDPSDFRPIADAANQLGVGYFLLDCAERNGQRCIAVIIPLLASITEKDYGRLVYVLLEEMRSAGCTHHAARGTSAMTHQLHLHQASDVAWVGGRVLDAKKKIKATKTAAQSMDRDRFTSTGGLAAQVQLNEPTYTFAADDGLFEGL